MTVTTSSEYAAMPSLCLSSPGWTGCAGRSWSRLEAGGFEIYQLRVPQSRAHEVQSLQLLNLWQYSPRYPWLAIGIEQTKAGIHNFSPVPDFIGLVRSWQRLVDFIPVPDWSDARQSGIYTHVRIRTSDMEMEMDKDYGCRNAGKMFSPESLVYNI